MAYTVNIGDLDRYLSLEAKTTSTGSAGTAIETWAEETKIWGKLEEKMADEFYQADQKVAVNECYWIIHFRAISPANNRLVYNGSIYNILGVQDAEMPHGQFARKRFLRLRCEKKDNLTA